MYFIPTFGLTLSVQRRGYWVDDRGVGVRFPVGVRNFSFLNIIQTGPEAHPASYPIGTGGVKGQGREAVHSPSSSAEVKNDGAIPYNSSRHGA
jgi:hypothetical protein